MSTRSLVGILNVEYKKVNYVYVHFDGYVLGGVGETLHTHFSKEDDVKRLFKNIEWKNLRSLRPCFKQRLKQAQKDEDYLDTNDVQFIHLSAYTEVARQMWAEFAYLFIPRLGWHFAKPLEDTDSYVSLNDYLERSTSVAE